MSYETNAARKPRASWKKRLLTAAFILINVAVIAATALSEFSDGGNASRFEDVTVRYELLLPALLPEQLPLLPFLSGVSYLFFLQGGCRARSRAGSQ